eukprot:CFRG4882T1
MKKSYGIGSFGKNIWGSSWVTSASKQISRTKTDSKSRDTSGMSAKSDELTPLMKSAISGNANDTWRYIQAGEKVNKSTNDGVTPLMFAAFEGHLDVVRLLISQKVDVNKADCSGDTALLRACDQGHHDTVRYLLNNRANPNHQNSHGENALMYAVRFGDFKLCQLLVEKEVEVNLSNVDGLTALMVAAERGNLDVLSLLLENGSWLMARDNDGDSALRYAALGGSVDTCQLLINKGMDPDLPNNANRTPLMSAVYKGHLDLVKKFTEWGANPNAKNKDGFTSIMYACDQGHDDVVKILLEAGADANDLTAENDTALSFACQDAHENIVRLLLEQGVKVNICNRRDCSQPLHAAVRTGNHTICELLLGYGADKEAHSCIGATPLMLAISEEHRDIVNLLLEKGVNISKADENGISAIDHASQCENKEIKHTIFNAVKFVEILNHLGKALAMNSIDKDKVKQIIRMLANQKKVSRAVKRAYGKPILAQAKNHKRSYVRVNVRALWVKWSQGDSLSSGEESSNTSTEIDLDKEVATDDVTSSTDSDDECSEDLDSDSDYDSVEEENSFLPSTDCLSLDAMKNCDNNNAASDVASRDANTSKLNQLIQNQGSHVGISSSMASVDLHSSNEFKPVRVIPLSLRFGMEIFQRDEEKSSRVRTIALGVRMTNGTPEFDVRENYVGRLINKDASVKKPFPKAINEVYWKDFAVPGPPGEIDLLTQTEIILFFPLEEWRAALGTCLALSSQLTAAPDFNGKSRAVLLFGEPYELPTPIAHLLYAHGINTLYYTHVPKKHL